MWTVVVMDHFSQYLLVCLMKVMRPWGRWGGTKGMRWWRGGGRSIWRSLILLIYLKGCDQLNIRAKWSWWLTACRWRSRMYCWRRCLQHKVYSLHARRRSFLQVRNVYKFLMIAWRGKWLTLLTRTKTLERISSELYQVLLRLLHLVMWGRKYRWWW